LVIAMLILAVVNAMVCLLPPMSRRSLLATLPAAAVAPSVAQAVLPLPTTAATAATTAPSAASEFYSGLLAGAVQKTVKELALHPLDTAKARLQVAGGRRQLLAELFKAPYAGLAPALISGAPAASTFFAIKDATKRSVASLDLGKTEKTLIAVAAANVGYWGVKNPSEVLKVRRQAGVMGDDTLGAARDIWREEGLIGFYRSAVPNYAYSTPVDSLKFLLYDSFKSRIQAERNGLKLSPVEAALGGAIAASTAQALATPLDVARVRIITQNSGGVVDTIRTIATDEGVAALYSGVAPKVARAVASGAIQFSTYEATKEVPHVACGSNPLALCNTHSSLLPGASSNGSRRCAFDSCSFPYVSHSGPPPR
jgi:solute carrier family 25 S-adenosylmethionine transporter 26